MASTLPDLLEGSPVRGSNIQDLMHGLSPPARCQTPRAMKSPGALIPTPMGAYKQKTSSPEQTGREIDDSAFLPDDFKQTFQEKENVQFTAKQLQEKIDEAVKRAEKEWTATVRKQLERENRKAIQEIKREGEQTLEEHTRSWEEDHLEALSRIKSEMIQQQEHQQLVFQQQVLAKEQQHQSQINQLEKELGRTRAKAERTEEELRERLTQLEESFTSSMEEKNKDVEAVKMLHSDSLEEVRQAYELKLELHAQANKDAAAVFQKQLQQSITSAEHQRKCDECTILELEEKLVREKKELAEQLAEEELLRSDIARKIEDYQSQIAILSQESDLKLCMVRDELNAEHNEEIAFLKSELVSFEETRKQVEQLQEANSILLIEIELSKATASSEKALHRETLDIMTEKHTEKIEELEKQFAVERIMLTERGDASRLEADLLSEKIKQLTESISDLENNSKEAEAMKKWWEDKLSKEKKLFTKTEAEMLTSHQEEIQRMKDDFTKALDEQKQSFQVGLDHARQGGSEREKELLEKLTKMEDLLKLEKEKFNASVQEVRREHAAQIDEMLAELDNVEAEHNQQSAVHEQIMEQKEAIIVALGKQLADATHKMSELAAEQELYSQQLATTEAQLHMSLAENEELKTYMTNVECESRTALEEEKRSSQLMCDQVRNETIAAAEEQFKKANEHYIALKYEYDAAMTKTAKLEKEVRLLKVETEKIRSEGASRVAEIAAELAQSRAALASAEASYARKTKEVQARIEEIQLINRALHAKLEDSNAGRNAANLSLATLVREKEALTQEVADLKAVCEDMMKMIEDGELAA